MRIRVLTLWLTTFVLGVACSSALADNTITLQNLSPLTLRHLSPVSQAGNCNFPSGLQSDIQPGKYGKVTQRAGPPDCNSGQDFYSYFYAPQPDVDHYQWITVGDYDPVVGPHIPVCYMVSVLGNDLSSTLRGDDCIITKAPGRQGDVAARFASNAADVGDGRALVPIVLYGQGVLAGRVMVSLEAKGRSVMHGAVEVTAVVGQLNYIDVPLDARTKRAIQHSNRPLAVSATVRPAGSTRGSGDAQRTFYLQPKAEQVAP